MLKIIRDSLSLNRFELCPRFAALRQAQCFSIGIVEVLDVDEKFTLSEVEGNPGLPALIDDTLAKGVCHGVS